MSGYLPGAVQRPAAEVARWQAAGYWTGQTFTDLLHEQVDAHGARVALVDGERRTTYAELQERSQRLAAGLHRRGIGAQDRVVVQVGSCTEFFEVCFALYRLGALPVFALPAHRGSEISYFVAHTEARAYVLGEQLDGADLRPLAAQLLSESPTLEHALVVGAPGAHGDLAALADCYADSLADAEEALAEVAAPCSTDVAFLQLSGGSTGLPKLIPRTHDEYLYTLWESARICGLDAHTVYLAVLPVAHNFPMSSPGCFGVFCVGGRVVLADGGRPDVAFALIERERVTITAVVPPLALVWLQAVDGGARSHDLSSLQVLQIGGAPLPESAARRVGPTLGVTLQQVFGMAEGLVNYTRLDDLEELVVTTQGRPISPDDELRIVDDHDQPLPVGATGHLLTRGPYTIQGYYRAEEHNRRSFTADGFYRTGDLASVTDTGHVRVEGRAKDQINRGGEKVAPEEVENHLLAHPDVHDAALVAMPDAMLGERTCAFVVPRAEVEPTTLTRRVLAAFLAARGVAAYKVPDRVVAVAAFPATGVGKTSKRDLRTAIAEQLLPHA
ncbi:AMP-binding protein [Rhodococcus sp. X156]|uniref:(2,3-dihydroxybenzoyl)adenylate synthase n=1 Tax=Rhodococcus sp. X156 TaxID=2499145 RepID=UPI000FDB2F47|nr:AMP-binding protein [Rhodococcus sp. X156]